MHWIDFVLMGIVALLALRAVFVIRKNKGSHCKGCNGCSAGCTDKSKCDTNKSKK